MTPLRALQLTSPADIEVAAAELSRGTVIGHPFANLYALTTRPDVRTVQATNRLKGRPPEQVGSLTTTPARLTGVWDLDALPPAVSAAGIHALLDALFTLGPFGFRGPAADTVPDHLTVHVDGVRTAQLIAPGYACPSNEFLAHALRHAGSAFLHITSANRSRHRTGAADEPAHFRSSALLAEFGAEPGFRLLAQDDSAAQLRYPRHLPMSTSVLALHRTGPSPDGRPTLVLERHGSLSLGLVRRAVAPLGFAVQLGQHATPRLTPRRYDPPPRLAG